MPFQGPFSVSSVTELHVAILEKPVVSQPAVPFLVEKYTVHYRVLQVSTAGST